MGWKSIPSQTAEMRRAVRTTLLGAIVGTAVEWYDFYLYATAAAAIFNKLFFPSYNVLIGTLLAYATFALGFFVRPLGSVLFGRLGDRIGRKRVLVVTLVLMGGSTFLMGLLPTYAQVGIWAPLGLTLLRMTQGLGSGAEYAGAVLMAVEYAPDNRRGLYGAVPYVRRSRRVVDVAGDVFAELEIAGTTIRELGDGASRSC
jgi:MHS family shikimate/dehydroshikimate transporter-like MFS transporter